MALTWWDLPGNSRFVGEVANALRSGRNVVLRVSERVQPGLGPAVRSRLDGDHLEWVNYAPPKDHQPIDVLYERFASAAPAREIRNSRNLVKFSSFEGLLVWIDEIDPPAWPAWADFLTEYESACRAVDPLDRTLLCVTSRGEATRHQIEDEVCLANITCRGTVRREDVQLYVRLLLEDRGLTGTERDLACRVISQLAMWDADAARALARVDLSSLLEPAPILKQIAGERGWMDLHDSDIDSLWMIGAADEFDGEWRRHSALYAIADNDRELDRRIWTAEVEVLLPWIESQRRLLLERFGSTFPLPFRARGDRVINDIRDLEIGHIQHLLYQAARRPDRDVMDLVRALKKIRNALSHLEPVGAEIVASSLGRRRDI